MTPSADWAVIKTSWSSVTEWDTNQAFQRSPESSAPEIEIIASAVSIQNTLLEVFSLFYKLLIGDLPSSLKNEFQQKINAFYVAVNAFEDFSLDAQDGLLVEELLMTGRKLENTFKSLLENEEWVNELTTRLKENQTTLHKKLTDKNKQIDARNQKLEYRLKIVQFISFALFLLLLGFLLVSSRKLIFAFHNIVDDTRKIRKDLSYRIKTQKSDYQEFLVVGNALNSMARTIEGNVDELKYAQQTLSEKVKERTAELETANLRLKKEIEDRKRGENERLELEARLSQAQKMEAIGMLAGGVAHDLNNILSGIVSFPELLLLELPEESPLRETVSIIKRSGEKAATIVQDLLTLARRGVQVTETINLNTIINDYKNSPEFANLSQTYPKIELRCDLDDSLGDFIGSPVHLSKIVMNLVSNAFEAVTESGRVTVKTSNRHIDTPIAGYEDMQPGDYVTLSVKDNGVGISEEDVQRIFEPFYTKKVMGRSGTGLGMAVVWGTVKDHKGHIEVNSKIDEGTLITIYFPVPTESIAKTTQADVNLSDIMGNGEKILVVDDVPEQLFIASSILKKLNYKVQTAPSGEAAVDYLKTNSADLVILDMVMDPGMDGLDTYKQVLAYNPNQKAVIASGFSETGRVKETMALGAGAYVKKPYSIADLGKAVYDELRK